MLLVHKTSKMNLTRKQNLRLSLTLQKTVTSVHIDLQHKITDTSKQLVIFFKQKKSLLELNKIQELEIEQLKKELENIRREFNEFKNLDTVPADLPLKTTNDKYGFINSCHFNWYHRKY
jgi:regulator of replication initiation timing